MKFCLQAIHKCSRGILKIWNHMIYMPNFCKLWVDRFALCKTFDIMKLWETSSAGTSFEELQSKWRPLSLLNKNVMFFLFSSFSFFGVERRRRLCRWCKIYFLPISSQYLINANARSVKSKNKKEVGKVKVIFANGLFIKNVAIWILA